MSTKTIEVNGMCMVYEDNGKGLVLLFIHGHPFDRSMWHPQSEALASRRYRVIAGLFWRRTAAPAARVLLVYFLLWFVLVKLSYIVLSPGMEGNYENACESAVIVAGAWVLYAWFATDRDRRWLGFATGDSGMRVARVFYSFAMIAFGMSHFFYLDLTAPLVPAWLPWHVGWAYFFGCTYVAAGAAELIGIYARLAAVIAAVQMGLFTLLVWIPLVVAGVARTSQVSEFIVSCILTAAGWVVADSYLGMPWVHRWWTRA